MDIRLGNTALCALLLSVVAMPLLMVPASAADIEKQDTVLYGDYEQINIGVWTSAKELHVTVIANASIDVYILTSEQMVTYSTGPIVAVKSAQNTMNADIKFMASPTMSYFLIIDNKDNGQPGNAIPKGDVTYTAKYPDMMSSPQDTVNGIFSTCLIAVVTTVVIVVVIIVLIIYFLSRRKADPPHQAPVPQAAYVPPPPQPAAPPPSPYEPPPPDYQAPQAQQYPPNQPKY